MVEGTDVFCLSQASPAACVIMDQASSSSSSSSHSLTMQLGGRTIDRHNPIISDSRRSTRASSITTSASPNTPQPSNLKTKTKSLDKIIKKASSDNAKKPSFVSKPNAHLITPPCSSRYLLGDKDAQFFDGLPDFDPVFDSVPAEDQKQTVLNINEIEFTASPPEFSSSQPKPSSSNQVVVLRVSLHCKGCEGKLRKHLSRMKGVTSYNIDFAAKKVTIVGDVTPSSVLASVSKVKNARFWAASTATAITHID